jgi:plastocyanin
VFTQASKVFVALSAAALSLALAYQVMTGDVLGSVLLLLLGVVAAYLSLAVATARHLDLPDPLAVPATSPGNGDAGAPVVRAPGGGAWPITAGLAATLGVGGFVLGPLASFAAMTLVAVTAVGWLGRVSAERTGRDPNLLPLGLPVLGLFAIASLMFFMSRILLAVPEQGSTWIALGVAVVIMAAGTLFALRPQISGRTMAVALAVGGLLMFAGGLVAAAVGERTIEHHEEHDSEGGTEHGAGADVEVSAKGIAFDTADLSLPAGADVKLTFVNADVGVPHNVAIYRTEDFKDPVYAGEVFTGEGTRTYEFKSPGPGTYHFRCDVHPNMKGKVTVQ